MVSLVVHAILGLVLIGLIVASNPKIFARPANGPRLSALECAYYAIGIAGTVLGYYFNTRFVAQYATGTGNIFWGPGSWAEFISLGYTNPAASNASGTTRSSTSCCFHCSRSSTDTGAASAARALFFGDQPVRPVVHSRTPSTSRPWSVSAAIGRPHREPARTVTSGA